MLQVSNYINYFHGSVKSLLKDTNRQTVFLVNFVLTQKYHVGRFTYYRFTIRGYIEVVNEFRSLDKPHPKALI
jgi:hypothetical protein